MNMKFLLPLCAAAALLAACGDRNKDTAVGGNGPSDTPAPATPPTDTAPPPTDTPPPSDATPPPDTATPDTATPPPPEGQPANPPPGG
jgi:hypothetical protein